LFNFSGSYYENSSSFLAGMLVPTAQLKRDWWEKLHLISCLELSVFVSTPKYGKFSTFLAGMLVLTERETGEIIYDAFLL
jgi:hypothetical protein